MWNFLIKFISKASKPKVGVEISHRSYHVSNNCLDFNYHTIGNIKSINFKEIRFNRLYHRFNPKLVMRKK